MRFITLEKLENALSSAHQSAPQRLDVLFSPGNTYILQGNINKALDVYTGINTQTGGDIDALTYLVMYKHYGAINYQRNVGPKENQCAASKRCGDHNRQYQ